MSTSGDYAAIPNALLTTNHLARCLLFATTLNADHWITLNGVNFIPVPSTAVGGSVDGVRVVIPAGAVIGAYAMSGTATSGWLAVSAV